MRYAIAIPQFYPDGTFDPAAFRAYLQRAEQLGFHSAWAQEQVYSHSPQLSPTEAMTFAASCTYTLRIGCTVYVSTVHSAPHLAKSLASLDQLSRGRLEVGVGTGGKNRPYAAFGMTGERYLTRFTEGVELMKALWTEQRVTFDGEFWQVDELAMEPKPFQKPHPPLWFGGSGGAAIRRAIRLGTGFFGAGSSPTVTFADQVKVVRETLAEAGRTESDFPIAKRIYLAVDDDGARARERMNAGLANVYGQVPADIASAAVAGTVGECVRGVREVIDAGAGLILFTALHDQAEQMERIASEIIPRLG
ncbi:LLM class flavin-dependent oxidoreductase [Amycolatopsis jejuensis]|uniref:LLM class flavin-dependent oxidoreductase n=1 Tax=Amycolatopsis jejuensis TaxID=330084 RepID=UPI0005255641|nr:LLM class flavin-dependent oxidoreductase [Amycolatopsis jejuensis]